MRLLFAVLFLLNIAYHDACGAAYWPLDGGSQVILLIAEPSTSRPPSDLSQHAGDYGRRLWTYGDDGASGPDGADVETEW